MYACGVALPQTGNLLKTGRCFPTGRLVLNKEGSPVKNSKEKVP